MRILDRSGGLVLARLELSGVLTPDVRFVDVEPDMAAGRLSRIRISLARSVSRGDVESNRIWIPPVPRPACGWWRRPPCVRRGSGRQHPG